VLKDRRSLGTCSFVVCVVVVVVVDVVDVVVDVVDVVVDVSDADSIIVNFVRAFAFVFAFPPTVAAVVTVFCELIFLFDRNSSESFRGVGDEDCGGSSLQFSEEVPILGVSTFENLILAFDLISD